MLFREENERSAAAMYALNDSIKRNRQAHEDNIRSIEINRRVNGDLIETLQDMHSNLQTLNAQENINDTDRAHIRNNVEQLNASLAGLNLTIDEETGLLTESSQALLAQAARYNDVNAGRFEAESILTRLNQAHAEAAEKALELEIIEKRRNRILEDENHNNTERRRLLRELDEQEQQIIETKGHLSDEIEILGNMHDEVYSDMRQNLAEFTAAEEAMTQAALANHAQQRLSLEDLSSTQREVVNELGRTFNNHVNQLRGANGKIIENNEFTAAHWRETMEHNQRVMGKWADNVNALTGRVSNEMLDYIRSLGPEHAHLVQEMVKMSDAELRELEAVFRNNCQVAASAALAGIDDAQIPMEVANLIFESERSMNDAIRDADFANLGLNLAEGLRDGIREGEELVGTGAAALLREAEEAARTEAETSSPSKVFDRIGGDLTSGLVQGLKRLQDRPTTQLQRLAQSMQHVYNRSERDYTTIGRNIMSGLNQGLLNGESGVMSTARRIALNIARTMRDALDINSPSRVMREQIGRFIPEGVAAGIDKYADAVIDSVYKLSDDLINLNLPSVQSMIGLDPRMGRSGVMASTSSHDNRVVYNNSGLFEGATINWNNEQDIRRTMEKMAWMTEREKARMW